ncbi:K+/H+ antiporter YhaU regulatory subunit KhtT [Clostridium acetobutylicum]|uniref:GntR/FadR-family transcriptional regulator fused to conserved membrane protein (YHCF B.subtilis homolog) n=1 Tax=Clostridium acetobutylicum (strain ATCC 824 / DSM 792 / JCM 1419 / IAM 19013 / LMG 5710 / NBRC 13948 / NRRL B-527 / VKM B-1787 / 2291 / W) TaxID=272562 RepID=Q97F90_CLOAB|nr:MULTISPECIES: TrkA C-terminal domain-containing protein [Clostridium]AAK80794.1 GntR/FadR-family transcriptional regulator fused to conserved membrane protein (YHCF B.subtilis homolog) [Clostridium acetobutylicum ATCC 824]ADZ21895.1 GntR/FadR-family transcriptional regulator fused to conserved membrane protein [Clostridium acetobutylicum EA 2018]AEI33098.1 fused transcriptional regulator/membrane protein [Clostridium acetobutylicum DSM 1731]AWV78794.1 GntR family transcriptional regulator [C
MSQHITKPVYQKIAIDIANRIVSGDFSVGMKLYGRSHLASQYKVSPETIRRAVAILNDMDIVKVEKGNGIIIESMDKCLEFIKKYKDTNSLTSLKAEIEELINSRNELEKRIDSITNELIDYSSRFSKTNPFIPFEFKIYDNLDVVGKRISETKFWQNTGATIIGIRRQGELILSPGPYATFKNNDVFIAIGDEGSYYRIKNFLYDDTK